MTKRSNPPLLVIRSSWEHPGRPVVLTDTEFGIAPVVGVQMYPRSEAGSVVTARFAPKKRLQVFVLDRQDRLLLRLRGDMYSPKKLSWFVDALGAPVTDVPGLVTPAEFDQVHPGLLSERDFTTHGYRNVLAVLLRVLAVVLVIMFVGVVVGLIVYGPPTSTRWSP